MRTPLLPVAIALLLAGCLGAPVPAGETGAAGAEASGPLPILAPEIGRIESPLDGAAIPYALVRPGVPEGAASPVLLVASPYFSPLTADRLTGRDVDRPFRYQHAMYAYFAERFVPHGYVVAFVPVRGTADAGGCIDLGGPKEQADLDHVVTWLGTQPWSNGAVAMAGLSYTGSTPWVVAATGNPHLRTIVPLAGVPDWYGFLYRNGSLNQGSYGYAEAFYHALGFAASNPANGREVDAWREAVLCPEALEGYRSVETSRNLERTAYWQARDHRAGVLANYRGSVFAVHGFADARVDPSNQVPFVRELAAQGVPVKLLLGAWGHAYPDSELVPAEDRRDDFRDLLLAWLDANLRGAPRDLGSAVEVVDSAGAWRAEATWPPADAASLVLHLGRDGALAEDGGDEGAVFLAPPAPAIDAAPAFEELGIGAPVREARAPCAACATFDTGPLAAGLRFAGQPTLHATVVPFGPGGHLAARLVVDGPDGARDVGRAQIDLRVADGTERAKDVTPRAPLAARMQFEPLDVVVPPGGRLLLVLSQGSHGEHVESVPTYPVEVRVGGAASALTLLAFDRGA